MPYRPSLFFGGNCGTRSREGGTVTHALEATFFSTAFGMCVDRFGTPWMVVAPDPNQTS